jgi:hypothetical protein
MLFESDFCSLHVKALLELPADFDSLQLKDKDKKDLKGAFEDYNTIYHLHLEMERKHHRIFSDATGHTADIVKLQGQLYEAKLHITSIIHLAHNSNLKEADREYLSSFI